jgi:tryptophan synthase alpha chain
VSRIARAFEAARQRNEAALVTYVTAGDPDLETSRAVLAALSSAGADVVELGVPFSDPSADGPVIQRASKRALDGGTRYADVLDLVRDLRAGRIEGADPELPVVLFGYLNPFLRRGEDLAGELKAAGVDGVLMVDLPPEEGGDLDAALSAAGIDRIRLLAPTTPDDRAGHIADGASGFLYYVSMTGVTGAALADPEALAPRVDALRARAGLPVGVGFGISGPEDAAAIAAFADGVVVGSALVRRIEEAAVAGGTGRAGSAAAGAVGALAAALKAACRRPAG